MARTLVPSRTQDISNTGPPQIVQTHATGPVWNLDGDFRNAQMKLHNSRGTGLDKMPKVLNSGTFYPVLRTVNAQHEHAVHDLPTASKRGSAPVKERFTAIMKYRSRHSMRSAPVCASNRRSQCREAIGCCRSMEPNVSYRLECQNTLQWTRRTGVRKHWNTKSTGLTHAEIDAKDRLKRRNSPQAEPESHCTG